MSTLFVEQLTVIDCAFLDEYRGLVGQSWIVDLELEGDLDAQSMVLDFSETKKRIKRSIDSGVDHTLIVPRCSPEVHISQTRDATEIEFSARTGVIRHRSPHCAVTLLDEREINAPVVAGHLNQTLREGLPGNVSDLRIRLREESIDGAAYHYVHGLKKHRGDCQRIAHGHRSRIEVRINGARNRQLEQSLADHWSDIYLASTEDLREIIDGRMCFAYQAPEGEFELTLPILSVDLLESDTTVERIAEQLARRISEVAPDQSVEVRAYEGVQKGAIGRVDPSMSGRSV